MGPFLGHGILENLVKLSGVKSMCLMVLNECIDITEHVVRDQLVLHLSICPGGFYQTVVYFSLTPGKFISDPSINQLRLTKWGFTFILFMAVIKKRMSSRSL